MAAFLCCRMELMVDLVSDLDALAWHFRIPDPDPVPDLAISPSLVRPRLYFRDNVPVEVSTKVGVYIPMRRTDEHWRVVRCFPRLFFRFVVHLFRARLASSTSSLL
jgi:hypothetical protein